MSKKNIVTRIKKIDDFEALYFALTGTGYLAAAGGVALSILSGSLGGVIGFASGAYVLNHVNRSRKRKIKEIKKHNL